MITMKLFKKNKSLIYQKSETWKREQSKMRLNYNNNSRQNNCNYNSNNNNYSNNRNNKAN